MLVKKRKDQGSRGKPSAGLMRKRGIKRLFKVWRIILVSVDVDFLRLLLSLSNNALDENTFGEDGYGFKAHKVLSTVRGKDFRHEKTKRKRGSYRGGNISLESKSFKYGDN